MILYLMSKNTTQLKNIRPLGNAASLLRIKELWWCNSATFKSKIMQHQILTMSLILISIIQ